MTDQQTDLTPPAPVPQPLPQTAPAPITPFSIALAGEDRPPAPGGLVPPMPSQHNIPALQASAETALLALPLTPDSLQSLQTRRAGKPRNGKIAHLPKLE